MYTLSILSLWRTLINTWARFCLEVLWHPGVIQMWTVCKHSGLALSLTGVQSPHPRTAFWCLQAQARPVPAERADGSLALSTFLFSWSHHAFLGHRSTWPISWSISTTAPGVSKITGCLRLKPKTSHLLCSRWGCLWGLVNRRTLPALCCVDRIHASAPSPPGPGI